MQSDENGRGRERTSYAARLLDVEPRNSRAILAADRVFVCLKEFLSRHIDCACEPASKSPCMKTRREG